ncbi:hypothetical protein QQM41_13255 (plasmid) [Acetobacter sp. AC2005]|uniref:hypothetical protein n=1 Tax=Acetobacter sp. AC2005 TaxID=3134142 RepID=UPI0030CC6FE8
MVPESSTGIFLDKYSSEFPLVCLIIFDKWQTIKRLSFGIFFNAGSFCPKVSNARLSFS